jgi:hypothetical protein
MPRIRTARVQKIAWADGEVHAEGRSEMCTKCMYALSHVGSAGYILVYIDASIFSVGQKIGRKTAWPSPAGNSTIQRRTFLIAVGVAVLIV